VECYVSSKSDATKFYAALFAGVSSFGTVWVGSIEGYPLTTGAEAAYYFMDFLGAGLVYNTARCDIEIKDRGVIGKEIITFFGPSVNGRYGLRRFVFTGSAAAGSLNWMFCNYIDSNYEYGIYASSIAGFLSAGCSYMITEHLGVGLKIQSTIGSLKNRNFERNPTALGYTMNFNFSF